MLFFRIASKNIQNALLCPIFDFHLCQLKKALWAKPIKLPAITYKNRANKLVWQSLDKNPSLFLHW